MQNIPDSLRGFQPDMDTELREVLEALEDENESTSPTTSDTEDPEDIFAELVKGGELQPDAVGDDEEGYESDDTVKAGINGSEYLAEMAQYKSSGTKGQ